MARYFAIRIGRAMITIALVVTFAFVVLRLSGDPALIIMGPEALLKSSPPSARRGGSTIRSGCNISIILAPSPRVNSDARCETGARRSLLSFSESRQPGRSLSRALLLKLAIGIPGRHFRGPASRQPD